MATVSEPYDAKSSTGDRETRRFRFKDHQKSPTDKTTDLDERREDVKRRRRHHHESRYRRKRRRVGSPSSPHPLPRASAAEYLNPDRAFQESLFDALGDDEGADFWQGVYGQPIHKYPNTCVDPETGQSAVMDDEEYAQYVRRKMWERSREGIEAEREQRRQQQTKEEKERRSQQQKSATPEEAHNNFAFDFEIESSLRRGRKRKDVQRWRELWAGYLERCDELRLLAESHNSSTEPENLFLRNRIAWPVESGKRPDVNAEQIERFVRRGVEASQTDSARTDTALLTALKTERVRWHPDKMQQRFGFMKIDDLTMQGITATFQVIDRLWNELKPATRA